MILIKVLVSGLILGTNVVAVPHRIQLAARRVTFGLPADEGSLDGVRARECSTEEVSIVEEQLAEAREIARLAVAMKKTDPAYRAFFYNPDAGYPGYTGTEDFRQSMYELVNEYFTTANKLLNEGSREVRIACGLAVGEDDTSDGCKPGRKALMLNSISPDARTMVLCPPFFKLAKSVPLGRNIPDGKGGTMNICEHPDQLQLANTAAEVMVHEIMHTWTVAPGGSSIIDCVYGGWLCGKVAQRAPRVALTNADSYGLAALSHRLNHLCNDFETTFHQPARLGRTFSPHKQPMGLPSSYERCRLPEDLIDELGLPKRERPPPPPVVTNPGNGSGTPDNSDDETDDDDDSIEIDPNDNGD